MILIIILISLQLFNIIIIIIIIFNKHIISFITNNMFTYLINLINKII
jgi:hypothetical protein